MPTLLYHLLYPTFLPFYFHSPPPHSSPLGSFQPPPHLCLPFLPAPSTAPCVVPPLPYPTGSPFLHVPTPFTLYTLPSILLLHLYHTDSHLWFGLGGTSISTFYALCLIPGVVIPLLLERRGVVIPCIPPFFCPLFPVMPTLLPAYCVFSQSLWIYPFWGMEGITFYATKHLHTP